MSALKKALGDSFTVKRFDNVRGILTNENTHVLTKNNPELLMFWRYEMEMKPLTGAYSLARRSLTESWKLWPLEITKCLDDERRPVCIIYDDRCINQF